MHVLLQWDNLAYVAVVSKALGHGVRRRKNIKRVKERKRKENSSSSPDPIFFFYFHMWVYIAYLAWLKRDTDAIVIQAEDNLL